MCKRVLQRINLMLRLLSQRERVDLMKFLSKPPQGALLLAETPERGVMLVIVPFNAEGFQIGDPLKY